MEHSREYSFDHQLKIGPNRALDGILVSLQMSKRSKETQRLPASLAYYCETTDSTKWQLGSFDLKVEKREAHFHLLLLIRL